MTKTFSTLRDAMTPQQKEAGAERVQIALKLERTIEQWSGCDPDYMINNASDAAIHWALCDAKADILTLNAELTRLRAENAALLKIKECAQRLVDHAESGLGGCLSDDSPARDIPSNAVSTVKARHLASLRAALTKHKEQEHD